jgi:hypothetical protein
MFWFSSNWMSRPLAGIFWINQLLILLHTQLLIWCGCSHVLDLSHIVKWFLMYFCVVSLSCSLSTRHDHSLLTLPNIHC